MNILATIKREENKVRSN